ncbi:hypothetical protein OS493_010329 [Desmophyllum pertusum]|uniref:Uncharacterized protein n=1 Tax=Desmophyllum pertusum TaxID=174260 RepID=A0A9X0A435_9CNID|nr:hypothetical protein OS493_010329 [Desmophyllum pertusum]
MMVPRPSQPSQAGVTNDPRSPAPTVPQQFRFPYPFVNPQAFANVNTGMAMGMPYSMLQNQTSVQSGMTPSQGRQGNVKPTEQYRVEHTGPTGVTKPTDVKRDIGQERRSSIGRGSRIHSLRRPATVPKVIQHQQASK